MHVRERNDSVHGPCTTKKMVYMTISTEIATPQNPPNQETQILRYLAIHTQIEI